MKFHGQSKWAENNSGGEGQEKWYYPCRGCVADDHGAGCGAANRSDENIVRDGSSPTKFCEEHKVKDWA